MTPKRKGFFDFDEMFPDLDEIEKVFEEMMKDFDQMGPMGVARPRKPLVYGFSMRVGPDGKPHVEEFGNVSPKGVEKVRDEREPLVDVINAEKEITVIAELPGVDKKDLHINSGKNSLSISVTDPERKYWKELKLPAEVDGKSAVAKLKNGILEVVLKKLRPEKPKLKGTEVKVE